MKQILLLFCMAGQAFTAWPQQMKINAGTRLINEGATVVLQNTGIQNDGIISGSSGRFLFSGTIDNYLSGAGTTEFPGMEIRKEANTRLILQQHIILSGPLVFTSGLVDLGNHNVQLLFPNGNLVNENEKSRITASGTGEIFIDQHLSSPNHINPGNLGIYITSAQVPGNTTIRRGHYPQLNTSQQSIARYYKLEPANNSALNASVVFHYFDAELNGSGESTLTLFGKEGNTWNLLGKDAGNTDQNFVQKNGVNSFHQYSLFSSAGSALPLKLLSFDAHCTGGGTLVEWITSNEINTAQFVIEKSSDGNNWHQVNTMPSKGNTASFTYTTLIHTDGFSYLRLRMEDVDGAFSYSPIRKPDCITGTTIVAGPNPTAGRVTIRTTARQTEMVSVSVVDMSGRTILAKTWQVYAGLNTQSVDLSGQPSSSYLIVVKGGGGMSGVFKIVKQ